ncbi:MAG: hypothetical protein A3C93_05990 [Candidatus Lloydbacteria bacterium RIFCSPHIGHO2_02_FULL_54_17]|uniref:Peptidoglycan binding-like domain-containing protein n=1 Tax=Candidatus Lloydbacteria bacterium RIFCSPHIGHO2_02_FULL_54_17 TaxID=1798664 RepID=A0A1G2DGG2_9BACT|nr:MAG: hypothetical protein A2762_06290 [Candidatus Lloydbacteria bacterium RIFCSPHIGHO2_01_FULL_54_11]OGZ11960.1 MAG: hypothetical protein A3C93_05990 [Candidatus Lloydbacteria bacterium RIFCSPHIGHO2_02_FULL_54_17]OGZ14215.1 MAG: hypothetical protein A2948_02680 [Candidatus Lloydbacteria bacterium RIFCSPLOWO2_01_FULL_54_18]OGZ15399.1 MAG: hypothetical protein A3H76_03525 [Candidatus Lloydbacteria bacterium RIFCSPLOWO2_02_FULL_54_12]
MRKNSLAKRTAVIFVALALFSLPSFANAAITYMRSQLGPEVTTPFTITVSAESFSDYGLSEGVDLYYITLDDDVNPTTECFPTTQLEASATFDVPVGDVVKGVLIVGFTGACETGDEPYYVEGDGSEVNFTVIGADHDYDTVFDEADNCPADANIRQENSDGDEEGDACDADDDNDGVNDEASETDEGTLSADNCPVTANEDQLDSDSDGTGDACDDTPLPPAPDMCPNISDTQESVPEGMTLDGEGQCVPIEEPAPPPSGGGTGGVPPQACANGSDDDADGLADYPNDFGCENSLDNDESGSGTPPPETSQGEVLGAATLEQGESSSRRMTATEEPALPKEEEVVSPVAVEEPISQGEVLGAATVAETPPVPQCNAFLTAHLRRGKDNDPEQVKLLQEFLNEEMSAGLPVTGFFGDLTHEAVKKFQVKYKKEILQPWIDAGYGDIDFGNNGTGYVYKTTLRAINMMKCATLAEPMPAIVPDSGGN